MDIKKEDVEEIKEVVSDTKVEDKELSKEQEAQRVLHEAWLKREKAFIDEYAELCKKHGLQVEGAMQLVVREIKK